MTRILTLSAVLFALMFLAAYLNMIAYAPDHWRVVGGIGLLGVGASLILKNICAFDSGGSGLPTKTPTPASVRPDTYSSFKQQGA